MPALENSDSIRKWHLVAFAGILLSATQGCGWEKKLVFHSPSDQNQIEITRGGTFSSRLQVHLVNRGKSRVVFKSPGEANFAFADAYWSPDEKLVALVINGTALFTLAFDVSSGAQIPFTSMRPQLETTMMKHYRIPPDQHDPIRWTYSGDAQDQFARRVPAQKTQ